MTTNLYAQVDVAKWGWDIAIFLWLVGISGMSTLAYYWVRRAPWPTWRWPPCCSVSSWCSRT